jgi:hypothetical protein
LADDAPGTAQRSATLPAITTRSVPYGDVFTYMEPEDVPVPARGDKDDDFFGPWEELLTDRLVHRRGVEDSDSDEDWQVRAAWWRQFSCDRLRSLATRRSRWLMMWL